MTGQQFMAMKTVHLFHQPFGTISGKSMADFFRCHKSDTDCLRLGFCYINKSRPVAETLSGTVNPPVILISPDAEIPFQSVAPNLFRF